MPLEQDKRGCLEQHRGAEDSGVEIPALAETGHGLQSARSFGLTGMRM